MRRHLRRPVHVLRVHVTVEMMIGGRSVPCRPMGRRLPAPSTAPRTHQPDPVEVELRRRVGDRLLAEVLADAEDQRPRWHRQAVCRGATATFFSTKPDVIDTAKRMCITCPVQGPCDAAAAAGDDVGVWAGRTQQQRRAARRAA